MAQSSWDTDKTILRQLMALQLRVQQLEEMSSGKGRERGLNRVHLWMAWQGTESTFQTQRKKMCVLLSKSGLTAMLLTPALSLVFIPLSFHCLTGSQDRPLGPLTSPWTILFWCVYALHMLTWAMGLNCPSLQKAILVLFLLHLIHLTYEV